MKKDWRYMKAATQSRYHLRHSDHPRDDRRRASAFCFAATTDKHTSYLQPCTELEFIREVARLRLAARRLVTAERAKIATIAAALPRHGTLNGDQIIELANGRNDLSLQSHW
jgi:hypothetical protein